MFCDLIIKGIPEISNFFKKLNINFSKKMLKIIAKKMHPLYNFYAKKMRMR